MKINGVNISVPKTSFKSTRTDRLTVEQLKLGEKPIIENNKQNIYAALNNLSSLPDRGNIEFLLDVADNLAYGQGGENSEFKSVLDEDNLSPENRENTDWSLILKDTISKALNSSSENVEDLQATFKRIFGEDKKITPEQHRLLILRKMLTDGIINEATFNDVETIEQTTNIRKNLDYFIASSEIPYSQKDDCLNKLIEFMSDDYKITPQLKDKKLQVLDEMLNDMIVKTPENDELTIKSVNQRSTGMCAAISICRKAVAYEDKSNYLDIVMEELKDSPTMSVYDVTELGSGKKIEIPKTEIDYNTAISKGYRILDASAHNWMHNAHASGDGTLLTEHYIPFDEDTYGIYNDSSWYLGLEENFEPEKNLLKALIKEKEYLKAVKKTKKSMAETVSNIQSVKNEVYNTQSQSNGKLRSTFEEIFPEKDSKEISNLMSSVHNFYNNSNQENEMNIAEQMPVELKQSILEDYIVNSQEKITDEQKDKLKSKIKIIYNMVDEYAIADKKLKSLQRYNTSKSKYLYNRQLFKLAASHRAAIEADINLPDGVNRFEHLTNLPPRNTQITKYLSTLSSTFSNQEVREQYLKEDKTVPTKEELENNLMSDMLKLNTEFPAQIDNIMTTVFGASIKGLVEETIKNMAKSIQDGDKETLKILQNKINPKADKKQILKTLKDWTDKLSNSPSQETVDEAVRFIGYDDRYEMTKVYFSSFIEALNKGITQEQFDYYSEKFGGGEDVISQAITQQRQNFIDVNSKYEEILKKWNVPSSKMLIMKELEKDNTILSRKKLDILKNRFDYITYSSAKNDSITNTKKRNEANEKLYNFTVEEKEIFDTIEKKIADTKKYSKMEYKNINKVLHDELEYQYSYIGMLNGQFWVREEGSSGLKSNEQIRIFEQMTGKPYHAEADVENAVQEIKSGKGSGVASYSVSDSDYAFHAQYVPYVTTQTFKDPKTNDEIQKEILWTDNSWGKAEKEKYWNGHDGHLYTDYGQGYGWKNGFIINDDSSIGIPVKDTVGAVGIAKSYDNDKFGLFSDIVLPGVPVNLYQKLYKMFGYIFNMKEGENEFSQLEDMLSNGHSLNIKALESIDDIATAKSNKLEKRLENEIKTEDDYNKLADDDELKFTLKKLAIYSATDNPTWADIILSTTDNKDLDEAFEEIKAEHLDVILTILSRGEGTYPQIQEFATVELANLLKEINDTYNLKLAGDKMVSIIHDIFEYDEEVLKNNTSLDKIQNYLFNQVEKVAETNFENEIAKKYFIEKAQNIVSSIIENDIKITSLDNPALDDSPLRDEFISAIDKYYNPSSDEELLKIIQNLQSADNETFEKFKNLLTLEDIGIKLKSPYYYVKLFNAGDYSVINDFSKVVTTAEIYKNLEPYEDEDKLSPEDLYRSLNVRLSELDTQKYVKAYKEQAFQQYNVRQAFPDPVIISDEQLEKTSVEIIEDIKNQVANITSDKYVLECMNLYNKINSEFLETPFCQSLVKRKTVAITEENENYINYVVRDLKNLYALSLKDETLTNIIEPLKTLISELTPKKYEIEGKNVSKAIKIIKSTFDDAINSGLTPELLEEAINNEKLQLNANIEVNVNANIDPRYRDEAFKKINNLVDLHRTDASQEQITNAEDDFIDFFVEKHIIKNPSVLLKECVKYIEEGKKDTVDYVALSNYLKIALRVAQQTKIQYKLVQNQHEAIGSKTKDMLPMFNVYTDGGRSEKMDTELGMVYLVEQLKNVGDNNVTLNLFLSQAGLSQKALQALLNNFKIDEVYKIIDGKIDEIQKEVVNIEKLTKFVRIFTSNSIIKYKSLSDAMQHLSTFVKRRYRNYEKNESVSKFIEYIDGLEYNKDLEGKMRNTITPAMRQLSESGLEYAFDNINNKFVFLESIQSLIDDQCNLLDSLSVPEDSEEFKARLKFHEEYYNVSKYLREKQQEILASTEKSKAFDLSYS